MWNYIKSFIYKENTHAGSTPTTPRQETMLIRHKLGEDLKKNNLRWNVAGWSQQTESHTEWTSKIENDITLPLVESIRLKNKIVSAKLLPIYDENKLYSLQYFIENFGQFNKNIKINYNLSSASTNEPIILKCNLIIVPKDGVVHHPCKVTHRYNHADSANVLIVSSKTDSTTVIEQSRKQIIDLPQTKPEEEELSYTLCIRIPLKKTPVNKGIYIRDTTKNIKATVLYYLYLDHKTITEHDIKKIVSIFTNFKQKGFLISKQITE